MVLYCLLYTSARIDIADVIDVYIFDLARKSLVALVGEGDVGGENGIVPRVIGP